METYKRPKKIMYNELEEQLKASEVISNQLRIIHEELKELKENYNDSRN